MILPQKSLLCLLRELIRISENNTTMQVQHHSDCECVHQISTLFACRVAINDMYTNNGKGNAELANLPRKLNIALSPSRDDFPHTHINDVGLVAVKHPDTGEVCLQTYVYSSTPNPSCMVALYLRGHDTIRQYASLMTMATA